MKLENPSTLPQSVKDALFKVWKGTFPKNLDDICYTYGDACYTNNPLSRDLVKHEEVHSKQQAREGMTPDLWWQNYGDSEEFRYEQEVEAYNVQYNYLKASVGERKAFSAVKIMAKDLSSEMYGLSVSYEKALHDILKYCK